MPKLEEVKEARTDYKGYSRRTKIFKKWLLETALRCGWENNSKRSITTEQIRAQIDVVANTVDRENYMPKDITAALIGAIDERKKFVEVLGDTKMTSKQFKATHLHFVAILEHAAAVLPREDDSGATSSPVGDSSVPFGDHSPTPTPEPENGWEVVTSRRRRNRHST